MDCSHVTPKNLSIDVPLAVSYAVVASIALFVFFKDADFKFSFRIAFILTLFLRVIYWIPLLIAPETARPVIVFFVGGFPTVLFFGGFSLVIRQWQQAFSWGNKCQLQMVRYTFSFMFVVAMLNEVAVCILGVIFTRNCFFSKMKGGVHGFIYSLAAVGFLMCGVQQVRVLKSLGVWKTKAVSKSRKWKGVIVSMLCFVTFFLRASWSWLRWSGIQWPPNDYMHLTDSLYYLLLELLPAALLLYLLRTNAGTDDEKEQGLVNDQLSDHENGNDNDEVFSKTFTDDYVVQ